jgi:hypothetical protein
MIRKALMPVGRVDEFMDDSLFDGRYGHTYKEIIRAGLVWNTIRNFQVLIKDFTLYWLKISFLLKSIHEFYPLLVEPDSFLVGHFGLLASMGSSIAGARPERR